MSRYPKLFYCGEEDPIFAQDQGEEKALRDLGWSDIPPDLKQPMNALVSINQVEEKKAEFVKPCPFCEMKKIEVKFHKMSNFMHVLIGFSKYYKSKILNLFKKKEVMK